MSDMDAAEDDLAVTVVHEPPHFVFDVFRRAAGNPGPNARDDTVRALEDAAVLHLHVRPLASVKMADAAGHVDDAQSAEDVGQFALVANDLEDAGQARDGLRVARGVAAHHDRPRARVVPRELPDDLPRFGVARACDRARIDDAQV